MQSEWETQEMVQYTIVMWRKKWIASGYEWHILALMDTKWFNERVAEAMTMEPSKMPRHIIGPVDSQQ